VKNEVFTINSFGFGKNHDAEMMSNISKSKDGNFYFVDKLDVVDECFIDALGGLMSTVATNLVIKMRI
jgi:hypothetical protein